MTAYGLVVDDEMVAVSRYEDDIESLARRYRRGDWKVVDVVRLSAFPSDVRELPREEARAKV